MTVQQAFSFWPSQLLHDFFPFSGQLCNVIKYFFSPWNYMLYSCFHGGSSVWPNIHPNQMISHSLTEFWFGVFKIAHFHGATEYFSNYTSIKIPLQLNSCLKPIQHTREEILELCLLLRRSRVSPGRPRSLLMSEKSVRFTSMMSTSHFGGPSRCINSSKFTKELWTIQYHKGRSQHIFCFNNTHLRLVWKSVKNLSSIDWWMMFDYITLLRLFTN